MPTITDTAALRTALEADPDDRETYLVYMDALEEAGRERAEAGALWLKLHGRKPIRRESALVLLDEASDRKSFDWLGPGNLSAALYPKAVLPGPVMFRLKERYPDHCSGYNGRSIPVTGPTAREQFVEFSAKEKASRAAARAVTECLEADEPMDLPEAK